MLVKYFADVRNLTGRLDEDWNLPAATLRELLLGLAERHGEPFRKRVMPEGRLSDTIIVLVNGQHVVHLDGLDTPLQPEATVSLFPMVAGG
jgi:molybdopterin synthase sulfur carrier subunit